MALKFLNKKGWHTGSLRNIEIVWKAEQKHEAEKRKLEELKKQILEEREAQEFRLLQEQAGLVPKQERLEFLYDSGLAVGRSSTDDYLLGKPLEQKKEDDDITKVTGAPGALFVEEKPQSANDSWRKLHSDPLLLIKQQEQAALMRIKNNPVKMDLIRKSVQEKVVRKDKRKRKDERMKTSMEKRRKKVRSLQPCSLNKPELLSFDDPIKKAKGNVKADYLEDRGSFETVNENDTSRENRRMNLLRRSASSRREHCSPESRRHNSPKRKLSRPEKKDGSPATVHISHRRHLVVERDPGKLSERHDSPDSFNIRTLSTSSDADLNRRIDGINSNEHDQSYQMQGSDKNRKQQRRKLTEEEKAIRLQEMQKDAELHEEQRWHRLQKALDADQLEARRHSLCSGRNFVNETARSVYGAAKGGNTSVEESVKRRTHFIERSVVNSDSNTFQRL